MERIVLTAPDGMIYTDGKTYGAKVWLEVGRSKDEFYLIAREEYERRLEEMTDGESVGS